MSDKKCCVPGCREAGGSHQVLHSFPDLAKDRARFDLWIQSIGGHIMSLENEHVRKYRRVCHVHFEKKYCCRYNRISNIAIPTINMPDVENVVTPVTSMDIEASNTETVGVARMSIPNITLTEGEPLRQIQNFALLPSTSKDVETVEIVVPPVTIMDIEASNTESVAVAGMSIPNLILTEREPLKQIQNFALLPSTSKDVETVENVVTPVTCMDIEASKTETITVVTKKRKTHLTSAVEHCLYKKLMSTRIKLSKSRNKIKKQAAALKAASNVMSNPNFIKIMENMPSAARILTRMQFRESNKKDKGRRFSINEKIFALSIFKQSPKGYRFLRKLLILPAPQTLTKLLSTANIKAGINKKMFLQLKKKAEKMEVQKRLCLLLFDEMSLKSHVSYNERKDSVTGFVTDGEHVKPDFADHAQVFMVRGLMVNYKQPVAYSFSAAATKGPELAKQIKNIVREIQNAGLIVVATICDQGTNNRQAIKILLQETYSSFLRNDQSPKENTIIIQNQEIVPLYDTPHLMKCIRNNFITKDLKYKINNASGTAKWHHLELLLKENPGYKGMRLIPKLTESHILPSKISKMKVKYATQVFSQAVGKNMGYLADKGILPPECQETADLLLFFDSLFDSLNGSFGKKTISNGKPLLGPVKPNSKHHQVWNEARKSLRDMKFINKLTGKIESVPTLTNWAWTLDGIELLLNNMNKRYGISSVWMRHLNQDPIENFFGSIRSHGCRNNNPTPVHFESAYTSLLINNLSSVHAPGSNCENDLCDSLYALVATEEFNNPETCDNIDIPNIVLTPIEGKTDPRVLGPLQYVSGYFARECKKKVFKTCNSCKHDILNKNEIEYISYREYAGQRWLCTPSDVMIACISNLQDIYNVILKKYLYINNIKCFIKTIIFMLIDFEFIQCKKHKDEIIRFLINISSRFFIHNHCKELNKILCGKRECDEGEDEFKNKAKKHFLKCIKRKK